MEKLVKDIMNTKTQIIQQYCRTEKDTGSCEVQIAILTHRIQNLSIHLKKHKQDFHSKRGLLMLVGARRRFLRYLKKHSIQRYDDLTEKLSIRKQ